MTDSQLIFGIMQNDERAWRHICREMKPGFASILGQTFSIDRISHEDIEDIFQESLIVLMQKVKSGGVTSSHEGALFSYLVQIGKFTACNLIRKEREQNVDDAVTFSLYLHNSEEEGDMAVDEKQQMQNDFLDKLFSRIPSECSTLLKHFYWHHKPMDEIASILGMRNADSVKSKKSKCMNRIKEIAARLIEDDEFAEEAIRNAIERAALRELVEDERIYANNGYSTAALDIDKEEKDDE
ncbi:MAG: sigma-70 family RNA polymerase sigma factor [Bacteroidaceae bacterium]|nr:sigma-70 family RNA polymerase sigma factor [Bacteroidaceae bacterium]